MKRYYATGRISALTAALTVSLAAPALGQSVADRAEFKTDFSKHTVPLEEIVSGGPPKDGIRSIDHDFLEWNCAFVFLVIAAYGGGDFSIDGFLAKRRSRAA